MTEFELKLEIPPKSLRRVVTAMRGGQTASQSLHARYYDTEDGLLAEHGLVVRVRREGLHWVQTAKGPSTGMLERMEHNVEIAVSADAEVPAVDLKRHLGTPVGRKILQALKLKPSQAFPDMLLLYEVDVQRLKRIVECSGSLVEVALDQGRILAGAHSLTLCELEFELKAGAPEHAVQLAREWCAQHGLWLSLITKSMKGQGLRSGRSVGSDVSATAPDFDRRANGTQIVHAVLQSCLKQVLANASEVAAGSADHACIHQLRVGIRRLRTALRELAPLADGMDPAWERPLENAFRALGQHRDKSRIGLDMQPKIEAAGGPVLDCQGAGADAPDPGIVVRAPAFQDVLLCLIGFAHRTGSRDGCPTHKIAQKVLRTRFKKLRSQLVSEGHNFSLLDEAQQHRTRKRLKRLRYLAEFCVPLFSARKTKVFVDALLPVQAALGFYNDELVALEAYCELATKDPRALFAVGWLSARREANSKLCSDELAAFAKVSTFWR